MARYNLNIRSYPRISSMPLWLVHKSLLHCPVLKTLDEVPIPSTSRTAPSATSTGSLAAMDLGRGWVVRWTRLQSDGGIGIQMACHSLYRWRYASSLLVERSGSLAARSCRRLRVQILAWIVLRGAHLTGHLVQDAHRLGVCRLRRVRRWRGLLMG